MEQIEKSPINNSDLEPFLSCKDHMVSKEVFTLFIDKESELLCTTPRPKDADLGRYYESEAYISHTDSKKSLFDKIYHWVRNYSLYKKLKLINSLSKTDKTILDIGAGTGDFLSICEKNNWSVVGVEPNLKARTIAKEKIQNAKVYSSIEELTYESSHTTSQNLQPTTYNIITLWQVLEHVPNLNEYVSTLKQLLKPNGTLIIAVPNYKSYDANYYKEFWAAYDVPRHLWHFSKLAIAKVFHQQEMTILKIIPMKFDAYYVSLLSEKYKTGKSNLLKAFSIGFLSNFKARKKMEYSSHIYLIKK